MPRMPEIEQQINDIVKTATLKADAWIAKFDMQPYLSKIGATPEQLADIETSIKTAIRGGFIIGYTDSSASQLRDRIVDQVEVAVNRINKAKGLE